MLNPVKSLVLTLPNLAIAITKITGIQRTHFEKAQIIPIRQLRRLELEFLIIIKRRRKVAFGKDFS